MPREGAKSDSIRLCTSSWEQTITCTTNFSIPGASGKLCNTSYIPRQSAHTDNARYVHTDSAQIRNRTPVSTSLDRYPCTEMYHTTNRIIFRTVLLARTCCACFYSSRVREQVIYKKMKKTPAIYEIHVSPCNRSIPAFKECCLIATSSMFQSV